MTDLFDPHWWAKLQINMKEGRPGMIGVHAFRAGHTCRYFEVPIPEFLEPTIWQHLHDLSEAAWAKPEDPGPCCLTCGMDLRNWERRYEGRKFCGFCGASLPQVPALSVEVK
jgi:hypothetical protein